MKLNNRQRRFITTVSIAIVVIICSQINRFGPSSQAYLESPNVGLLTLVDSSKQADTPEAIGRACLPSMDSAGAELVGEYKNPTSTQLFQVWKLFITPDHTALRVQGLYVNDYGTACLLAYDERYNQTIGDDLSEADAQQVALVIWRYRANIIGGTEALQTSFNNSAAELEQYGEVGYVAVEDKWALEELGIELPSVYQIYNPDNPPTPIRSRRGDI